MSDKPFFDTNIVLYAFRKDDARGTQAETLLAAGGTVSVQVLNEFATVARRRFGKSWKEVQRALNVVRTLCPEPVALTVETHEHAVSLAERHGYGLYDSLIIAAALGVGSRILYSEDMRDGQVIANLTIRNPFPRGGKAAFTSAGSARPR